MKILVCEDEEMLLTSLEFRLRKQGFEVIRATDGQEAKDKVQAEMPDLIIADIMMTNVSGLELTDFIRNEMKSAVPIIMISALGNDDTVLEAFQLGANDFISKPFKPIELVLRIKKIFQEQQEPKKARSSVSA